MIMVNPYDADYDDDNDDDDNDDDDDIGDDDYETMMMMMTRKKEWARLVLIGPRKDNNVLLERKEKKTKTPAARFQDKTSQISWKKFNSVWAPLPIKDTDIMQHQYM